MKPLTSLAEHNAAQTAMWESAAKPYPRNNGIACPVCGAEMQDVDNSILSSNPPKKAVRCPACNHTDLRLV